MGTIDSLAGSDGRQMRALAGIAGSFLPRMRTDTLAWPDVSGIAALVGTVPIMSLGPGEMVLGALVVPTQKWNGAGVAAVSIEIGTLAAPAAFLGAQSLFVNPGPAVFYAGPLGFGLQNLETRTQVLARLTCNVNLSLINAGAARVHLLIGTL